MVKTIEPRFLALGKKVSLSRDELDNHCSRGGKLRKKIPRL
jgi:hypothetical protein